MAKLVAKISEQDRDYDLLITATTGGERLFPQYWFSNNNTHYSDNQLATIVLSDAYNRFFNSRFGLEGIQPVLPPTIIVFAQWFFYIIVNSIKFT